MFSVLVYLDYNSTTPTDKRVVDAMLPVFTKNFGNPSSTHDSGLEAHDMIDDARKDVATLIGANMGDVVFTSGATEANNMAISSYAMYLDGQHHLLYGATEHKSVIESYKSASKQLGLDAIPTPVNPNGTINMDSLREHLEIPTSMVSIMMANSETGVINPIKEISKIVHEAGAILHSDITQAVGKIPVDVFDLGIDIATLSSHKLYGPKGCGAIVASRNIRKNIIPLIHGGGQENNLRSGTQNVPGIVGFGMACQIAREEMIEESSRIRMLRDNFEARIKAEITNVTINGENTERLPNTSSIRIHGAIANAVIVNAKKIEISSGSACSSFTMEPSHVLLAMGFDGTEADESIRISIGRYTTMQDIEVAIKDIANAAEFVRRKELETGEIKQC